MKTTIVSLLLLLLPNAVQSQTCENTCEHASDGECDDGSPGALYSICECGTDCDDCGTQTCETVAVDDEEDEDDCSKICTDDGNTWCCDPDDRCGDAVGDTGYCITGSGGSKSKSSGSQAAVIAIAIIIPVAIVAGILACCFCCTGCPGYQCIHKDDDEPVIIMGKVAEDTTTTASVAGNPTTSATAPPPDYEYEMASRQEP